MMAGLRMQPYVISNHTGAIAAALSACNCALRCVGQPANEGRVSAASFWRHECGVSAVRQLAVQRQHPIIHQQRANTCGRNAPPQQTAAACPTSRSTLRCAAQPTIFVLVPLWCPAGIDGATNTQKKHKHHTYIVLLFLLQTSMADMSATMKQVSVGGVFCRRQQLTGFSMSIVSHCHGRIRVAERGCVAAVVKAVCTTGAAVVGRVYTHYHQQPLSPPAPAPC